MHRILAAPAAVLGLVLADDAHLGHPVDQVGHGRTAGLGHLLQGHVGILDHIMQDRRRQALVVQAQAGKDIGHGDGMGQVGFAGGALLVKMGLFSQGDGAADQRHLGLGTFLSQVLQPCLIVYLAG